MPVTRLGIPYPGLDTDPPDGPDQMQAMAQSIDSLLSHARWRVGRGSPNPTDALPVNAMAPLMNMALPASAPGGLYQLNMMAKIGCSATATINYRVLDPTSTNLSGDVSKTLSAGLPDIFTFSSSFTWIGGSAASVGFFAQLSAAGGTVYNAPCFLEVFYIGPLPAQ